MKVAIEYPVDVQTIGHQVFRVLVCTSPDISDALLLGGEVDAGPKWKVDCLIRSRYGDKVQPSVTPADPLRSDVLIRVLENARVPQGVLESHLDSAFSVWQEKFDLIVLSVEPEVSHSKVWEHRETGYLLDPHSVSSDTFLEGTSEFGPGWKELGLPSARDSALNLSKIVKALKKSKLGHIVFLNGSTLVPEDDTYRYRYGEETTSERIRRLNLSLLEISLEEGVSIIDVDRLIAEIGGGDHVLGPLRYSPAACQLICDEFLRVVEDIGFFDERPLLPQVGQQP